MRHKGPLGTIRVRNLPADVAELVRRKARAEDLSLSKAVIGLLQERLEFTRGPRHEEVGRALYHDLNHLAGTWTDGEANEFDALLREQRRIDPELWSSLPSR